MQINTERVTFVVRSGVGGCTESHVHPSEFSDFIEYASRAPRNHSGGGGWVSVRYGGRRYQLFGGARTPYFISLNNPINGRA